MLTNINNKQKLIEFLLEITGNEYKNITYIENLVEVYPNIIEYMLSDNIPDLSNVKFIKQKRYSQLKEKVLNNYDILELNSKLNDLFPLNILKLLKKYYEDKFLDSNVRNNYIAKQIINNPYDTLCNIDGLNFLSVDKLLLQISLNENSLWEYDLSKSAQRLTSFIIWYLINQLNGSTYVPLKTLKGAILYKYDLLDCISYLDKVLKSTSRL